MIYKSRSLILVVLIVSVISWFNQLAAQESFTVEQAIDYAIEHQAEIKKAYLNIEDAEAQIKETRAIGYPKLNGTGQYQYFIELPTSILPGTFMPVTETVQIEDVNGNLHDLRINSVDENGNIIPGEDLEANFGTKNSLDLGLNFEMLLFDGSYIVGLQTAKMYREFADLQVEEVEFRIRENVTRAFYNLLVVYESQEIAKENIETAKRNLFENEKMYEEGFIEKLDVDRIKFSLRNLIIQENRLKELEVINKNLLKLNMGYPIKEDLQVIGDIEENVKLAVALYDASAADDFQYADRPEYIIAQRNRDINAMNIKRYKYSYLPSLSMNARYNQTLQGDKLSSGTFFPSSLIGLNLNVPIYDGRDKKSKIERAEITVSQLDTDISELERSIDLEIANSQANLSTAYQSYVLAQENVDLAMDIYNTTRIKYQEGVGSSVEVRQAESDQYAAQNQLVDSQINLINAKIDLDKALGKL